ncbi:YicC/YloC family endoribonuclease [Paenibacillus hodogayensis]|uniref:YicC/YloC family endoribonuclease n=1 Tax=Paenibacillus hodogayensis TaxID=279208 RepID=A0ABV5VNW7_9BACL
MIRSMTGFGQHGLVSGGYRLHAEVRSVNHRYAEIAVRIPREWLSLEDEVKREIQHAVRRGKVEAFVTIEKEAGETKRVEIDWTAAERYVQAAGELKARFGLTDSLSLKDLLTLPDVLVIRETKSDAEALTGPLLDCVREAVGAMVRMRETEGTRLSMYVHECLVRLERLHGEMAETAAGTAEEHMTKLRTRLTALLGDAAAIRPDDPRLVTEVALMADKCDIGEELSRLSSHFEQCRSLLAADEPAGRRFDFLVQEMNREVNTIGSKSNRLEFAGQVIEMKAELEKMREQAQNIE